MLPNPFPNRLRQRLVEAHRFQSGDKSRVRHSVLPGEIKHQNSLATKLDEAAYSPVSVGHGERNPSAVAWLVPAIIVDAIKQMSRWTLAHIRKEYRKRCLADPPLTNCYAAPAVVGVGRIVRVEASSLHTLPGLICRRPGEPVDGNDAAGYLVSSHRVTPYVVGYGPGASYTLALGPLSLARRAA